MRFTPLMRSAAPVLLAALWTMGCEKPPLAQMDSASQSVEKARSAQAATYAASELARLEDSLRVAQAEVQHQNDRFIPSYEKAKQTLAWVEKTGPEVVDKSHKVKEETRAQTRSLIDAAAAAVASADQMLAEAPRGKGSQQDIELIQNDLTQLRGQLDAANQHLTAERFTEGQSAARAIKTEADRISGEIQAAKERVEQLRGKRGR